MKGIPVRAFAIVLVALLPAIGCVAELVYSNDFGDAAGELWSEPRRTRTPIGPRPYLGLFGPEEVTLTLTNLGEHAFLRVSVSLMLASDWDGSGHWGPDIWQCRLDDGRNLVLATFNNCGLLEWNAVNRKQTFPDNTLAKITHRAGTGAIERGTLGYWWQEEGVDSVYRFDMVFPHSKKSAVIHFAGRYAEPGTVRQTEAGFTKAGKGQFWGVDDVQVHTLAATSPLDEAAMNECWQNLAGDDAVLAHKSVWRMVASPGESVPFIRSQYDTQKEELRVLLLQLEAETFPERMSEARAVLNVAIK